jgi:hypothetical protein
VVGALEGIGIGAVEKEGRKRQGCSTSGAFTTREEGRGVVESLLVVQICCQKDLTAVAVELLTEVLYDHTGVPPPLQRPRRVFFLSFVLTHGCCRLVQ